MSRTQNRLATGKKVNSALDNPTNYFVAAGLDNRSNDLSRLLDSMGLGIKTLEAADNGITAIKKLIETAQGTARQALQAAFDRADDRQLAHRPRQPRPACTSPPTAALRGRAIRSRSPSTAAPPITRLRRPTATDPLQDVVDAINTNTTA